MKQPTKHKQTLLLAGLALVMMACSQGKTQPQRPTFLGQKAEDTVAVNLLLMHQTMAEKADLLLAQTATEEYVLTETNYWVKGLETAPADQPYLKEGDYVDVEIHFYDLQQHLLAIHQANVRIGQVDEIQAVVDVLDSMKRGMSVTMLVPWYLAFGSAGNTEVPPYENVKVELNVK